MTKDKPVYAVIDQKSVENAVSQAKSAARYRAWVLENFNDIGEEALIALFGCRGFHELRAEFQARPDTK